MDVRAGIVVTGTEVLTGRVADRNGPWLAEELRRVGVDVGQIVVVGDRVRDLDAALRFLAASHHLVIASGGLGPTADDLTAEVVARVQGRPMLLDPDLEARIEAIVAGLTAQLGSPRDPEATAAGTRKQATVPAGATVLEPTGTAPGLVVPVAEGRDGPPVVVLPGPPAELRRMWPAALAAPAVRAVLDRAPSIMQRTLRLWGVPESELAASLRRAAGGLAGLEITTCLRDGELEIVSRYHPDAEPAQQRLAAAIRADYGPRLFSPDGADVDEIVDRELRYRGWTVAVVDTLTGGRVGFRLADRSDGAGRFRGAVVLPAGTEGDGSAGALAAAARSRFGADVGIGMADSPGGPEVTVVTPDAERTRRLRARGTMAGERVAGSVLHLLRSVLTEEDPTRG